jgi:hypothetical protein
VEPIQGVRKFNHSTFSGLARAGNCIFPSTNNIRVTSGLAYGMSLSPCWCETYSKVTRAERVINPSMKSGRLGQDGVALHMMCTCCRLVIAKRSIVKWISQDGVRGAVCCSWWNGGLLTSTQCCSPYHGYIYQGGREEEGQLPTFQFIQELVKRRSIADLSVPTRKS